LPPNRPADRRARRPERTGHDDDVAQRRRQGARGSGERRSPAVRREGRKLLGPQRGAVSGRDADGAPVRRRQGLSARLPAAVVRPSRVPARVAKRHEPESSRRARHVLCQVRRLPPACRGAGQAPLQP
jgi:hypothetical protein